MHGAPEATPARGHAVAALPGDATTASRGPGLDKRFAVLVGVNHYIDRNIADLRFCVNDVVALDGKLTALGYIVTALSDAAAEAEDLLPTLGNVRAELESICRAAGPNDLIWVHCACHGMLVHGQAMLLLR